MAATTSKSKRGPGKKYHIALTPFSMALWIFALFFLLAWIFALGIFVGRGYFPGAVTALADLKGQIARLQETVGIGDKDRDLSARRISEPDPKLAFYEKLSSKRDEAKKQEVPQKPSQPASRKEAKNDSEGPKPTDSQREPRETIAEASKSSQPAPATGQYTVQIASLADKKGAEKLIKQLVSQGYDAYYTTTDVKGKTYYRVRCGVFAKREDALHHAVKLRKSSGLKSIISRIE